MKRNHTAPLLAALLLLLSCTGRDRIPVTEYLDYSGTESELSGGVRMIPISTPQGEFSVWTKRIGNNPDIKVLLLHGGPGASHKYLEAFDSFFPKAGIEYYHYDQLGSHFSDQPGDTSLWNTGRFVEEVEQVRRALDLDENNFYLYGHSWGGILAIEYALKYQENLKGLIISNMMASVPEYNRYAEEVLAPQMDPDILAEIQEFEAQGEYENPRYMQLLMENYYTEHILRLPLEEWPMPVNRGFEQINPEIYIKMQGPSEFGIIESATLHNWDRTGELSSIEVPTLVIGAEYDTMDPEHMEWMAGEFPYGRYLYCPNGSHLAMYDDQQTYFGGLVDFVKEVDAQTR